MRRLALPALLSILALACPSPNGVFTAEEAARICASLQTCSPREFQFNFGNSMQACTTVTSIVAPSPGALEASLKVGSEKVWGQIYKCILDAHGDCSRVTACFAPGAPSNSCVPASLQRGACNGETLAGCTADGRTFAIDCASQDAVCVGLTLIGAPVNICAVARCPATRAELQCRGTFREGCLGDAVVLGDCTRLGGRCEVVTDGGEPQCVGETCSVDFPGRCEGDVAVSCVSGLVSRSDCATNAPARRCDKGRCVPSGNECADEPEACSGPALTFCQDGFKRELNCIGAGFSGCSAGACVSK